MVKMLWSQATKKFQDFNRNLSFSSSLDARQKNFERFFFPTRAAARVTNERVKSGQDSGKQPSKMDNRKKMQICDKDGGCQRRFELEGHGFVPTKVIC